MDYWISVDNNLKITAGLTDSDNWPYNVTNGNFVKTA